MTALTPLYIKKLYQDDPHFEDTKIVYSVYEDSFNKNWDSNFYEKLKFDGFKEDDIASLKDVDFVTLNKMAINVSDGVIQGSETINEELSAEIKSSGTPSLEYYSEETCVKPIDEFYDQIIGELVEN